MNTHTAQESESYPIPHKNAQLTVADAVWVGTALLHKRCATEASFSTEDIVNFVTHQRLTEGIYKSIWQHVNQHCVANRKPHSNNTRILFATGQGNRRLFRDGDSFDSERAGTRTHPDWHKLPPEYADLQGWYENTWNTRATATEADPLIALIGSGKEIWAVEHADEYVTRLRTNWEGAQ